MLIEKKPNELQNGNTKNEDVLEGILVKPEYRVIYSLELEHKKSVVVKELIRKHGKNIIRLRWHFL